MLLNGHKASFDNFSILLKENNSFKLQLKESLLKARDKSVLNRNIYWFTLEPVDWLQHFYFYCIYIHCYLCIPMFSAHHYFYCKIVVTVELLQFDASNWSESLFVKFNKLWICRKYFCLFCNKNVSQIARKIFSTRCSFTDHLKHKIISKTTCRKPLAYPR